MSASTAAWVKLYGGLTDKVRVDSIRGRSTSMDSRRRGRYYRATKCFHASPRSSAATENALTSICSTTTA